MAAPVWNTNVKSALKNIFEAMNPKEPNKALDRIRTATGITHRLLKGYCDAKMTPNVTDALKIAEALGMPVERIWVL